MSTKFEDLTIQNSLGTKGNISSRAKSFLEYVNDRIVRDAFTQEIADEVTRLKRSSAVRRQYMLLEMKLHDARMDGREEGMIEAQTKERQSTALDMLKDKEPLRKIVKYARLSEEEIYALAQANGLAVIE